MRPCNRCGCISCCLGRSQPWSVWLPVSRSPRRDADHRHFHPSRDSRLPADGGLLIGIVSVWARGISIGVAVSPRWAGDASQTSTRWRSRVPDSWSSAPGRPGSPSRPSPWTDGCSVPPQRRRRISNRPELTRACPMSQNNRERLRASQKRARNSADSTGSSAWRPRFWPSCWSASFAVVLLQNQSHQTTASSVTPPNAPDASVVVPGRRPAGLRSWSCSSLPMPGLQTVRDHLWGGTEGARGVREGGASYRTMTFPDTTRQWPPQAVWRRPPTWWAVLRLPRQITPTSPRPRAAGTTTPCWGHHSATVGITAENLTTFSPATRRRPRRSCPA